MERPIFKDYEEDEVKREDEIKVIVGVGNFYCANVLNQPCSSFLFIKRNQEF